MTFNYKISVYVILFHDLQFLDDIISYLYDFVDEIVIVDGPYYYCIDVLKKLNLFYEENNKPKLLETILMKYSEKIKYSYRLWKDEKEKRMYGYSQCSNDYVMLVDCDEFIFINPKHIVSFIESDKSVAGFSIYNMIRTNIHYGSMVEKYIFFKKKNINALQHLSYTWLIGIDNLERRNNKFFYLKNTLGTIYHQTLNRNELNSVVKHIFYNTLYYYNKKIPIEDIPFYLFWEKDIEEILKCITIEDLKSIIHHSKIVNIHLPSSIDNNPDILLAYTPDIMIDSLKKYSDNHFGAFIKPNTHALKYVNFYAYCQTNHHHIDKIEVQFKNVFLIHIELYEINIQETYQKKIFSSLSVMNNKLILDVNVTKKQNHLCFVLCFRCLETIDKKEIYEILQVENIVDSLI
jgi:hypothetical protein